MRRSEAAALVWADARMVGRYAAGAKAETGAVARYL